MWRCGRAADALFLAQRLAEGEVQELGHQVEEHVFLHHRDLPERKRCFETPCAVLEHEDLPFPALPPSRLRQ